MGGLSIPMDEPAAMRGRLSIRSCRAGRGRRGPAHARSGGAAVRLIGVLVLWRSVRLG